MLNHLHIIILSQAPFHKPIHFQCHWGTTTIWDQLYQHLYLRIIKRVKCQTEWMLHLEWIALSHSTLTITFNLVEMKHSNNNRMQWHFKVLEVLWKSRPKRLRFKVHLVWMKILWILMNFLSSQKVTLYIWILKALIRRKKREQQNPSDPRLNNRWWTVAVTSHWSAWGKFRGLLLIIFRNSSNERRGWRLSQVHWRLPDQWQAIIEILQ